MNDKIGLSLMIISFGHPFLENLLILISQNRSFFPGERRPRPERGRVVPLSAGGEHASWPLASLRGGVVALAVGASAFIYLFVSFVEG